MNPINTMALIQYDKYTTGNAWMHYDLYIQKHHKEWTNMKIHTILIPFLHS